MGLEVDVAKIACKINEVKEESTIGLHQRVRDVQNQFSGWSVIPGHTTQRLTVLNDVSQRKERRFQI